MKKLKEKAVPSSSFNRDQPVLVLISGLVCTWALTSLCAVHNPSFFVVMFVSLLVATIMTIALALAIGYGQEKGKGLLLAVDDLPLDSYWEVVTSPYFQQEFKLVIGLIEQVVDVSHESRKMRRTFTTPPNRLSDKRYVRLSGAFYYDDADYSLAKGNPWIVSNHLTNLVNFNRFKISSIVFSLVVIKMCWVSRKV